MKIRPMGAELIHADGQTDGRTNGQTDIKKLVVAFRKFAKAPNETLTTKTSYNKFIISHTHHIQYNTN